MNLFIGKNDKEILNTEIQNFLNSYGTRHYFDLLNQLKDAGLLEDKTWDKVLQCYPEHKKGKIR